MNRLLLIISFSVILAGCKKKETCIPHPDTSNILIDLQVERLDLALQRINTTRDLGDYINSHKAFKEFFLNASQYPNDEILLKNYLSLLKNPGIDTLFQETQNVFSDFLDVKNSFHDAFALVKYYYPNFHPPIIQTAITGISHDLYVSDSVIIIGLDYFLGDGATYRPMVPEYIKKRFRKESVVPNTILLMSNEFNKIDLQDNTLMAEMIYYGKAYYFTKQMLPCVADSVIIGYTSVDIKNIERGKEIIWANFIENEAFFETDHMIKDKFISERPKTFEIGVNCPGRIGRWIGWEIVKAFMKKNPDISLHQLMRNDDAQDIFTRSKYKPRR